MIRKFRMMVTSKGGECNEIGATTGVKHEACSTLKAKWRAAHVFLFIIPPEQYPYFTHSGEHERQESGDHTRRPLF